jgi:hypothetical protein
MGPMSNYVIDMEPIDPMEVEEEKVNDDVSSDGFKITI